MPRGNNLYAIDRDNCPNDDSILYTNSCKGCKFYQGFKIVKGVACIECSYLSGSSATKAKNKYNAANYDSLRIVVPKGKKQIIKDYAKSKGKSINGFVNEAIDKAMQGDIDIPASLDK